MLSSTKYLMLTSMDLLYWIISVTNKGMCSIMKLSDFDVFKNLTYETLNNLVPA